MITTQLISTVGHAGGRADSDRPCKLCCWGALWWRAASQSDGGHCKGDYELRCTTAPLAGLATAAELIELASLKNPPPVAVAVANAVCILLGAAPSVSTTPSKAPPSGAVSYWNAFKEMIRPRPFDRTAPEKFVKKLQTTPIAPDAVAAVTAYVGELVRVQCPCQPALWPAQRRSEALS